jgi:hypothetical protein
MSDLLTRTNFIESPDGGIMMTIEQDQTGVAQAVSTMKEEKKGWSEDRTMKMSYSIPMQEYVEWQEKLGQGCWEDDDFLKWWGKANPHFAL